MQIIHPKSAPAAAQAAALTLTGAGAAPESRPRLGAAIGRQAIALTLLAVLAFALRDRLAALDRAAILDAFARVSAGQWALAGLATALSFAALAQYDVLIHRWLGTGVAPRQARRAGWTAIALSQTLGLGLVTGSVVRWRMLPEGGLAQASRVTAAAAATFLAAWAVLSAHVVLFAPVALPGLPLLAVQGLALAALALGGALGLAALVAPELRLGRWRLRLPPLAVLGRILALAALDTGLAAAALWVLLPPEAGLSIFQLFPAFLLALGAGFVSGTPGGLGPFEITLVTLLPGSPEPALLAAVLAWRLAYYGAPAALALAVVALAAPLAGAGRGRLLPPAAQPASHLSPRLARLIDAAAQAELGLLRQGEHGVLSSPTGRGGWMVGRAGQRLVGLLDPFGDACTGEMLGALHRAARAEGRGACLYKVSPRIAAKARAAGWAVAPVATEVWLDPRAFSLDTPARAGLRRKLRKAEKSGLKAGPAPRPLALAELAALCARWVQAHGGERGFSMGRFAPDYLGGQEVFVARQNGRLLGFASFHANRNEWVLDLMRPAPDAPDGTMQALIAAAIAEAGRLGVARLSLAALPPRAEEVRGPAAHIWRRAEKGGAGAGLRQFKMGFAPRLSPRYLAAPSAPALALAAAEIARAIHHPAPLPPHALPPQHPRPAQDHLENKEFALFAAPWQEGANPGA